MRICIIVSLQKCDKAVAQIGICYLRTISIIRNCIINFFGSEYLGFRAQNLELLGISLLKI